MIPRRFHYYWTGQQFQFVHYLAVRSLVRSTSPRSVEVHCEEQPRDNPHWYRLQELDEVRVAPVDFDALIGEAGFRPESFGAFLAAAETVHRSDFVRYLALAAKGGVYLDFDTVVVRDLSPLLDRPFLLGYQAPDVLGNDVNGAVLGAAPGSEIIRLCLERVRAVPETLRRFHSGNFRRGLYRKFFAPYLHWCDTGPSLLTALSRQRCELRAGICPRSYFHSIDYRQWRSIFEPGALDGDAYVLHFFGKLSFELTKRIDERYVRSSPSVYAGAARACLDGL